MQEMTEAYARLSMMLGYFAGSWDGFLGETYFITKIRRDAWQLSAQYLTDVRAEARAMGVPEDLLVIPEEVMAHITNKEMVSLAMRYQNLVDG